MNKPTEKNAQNNSLLSQVQYAVKLIAGVTSTRTQFVTVLSGETTITPAWTLGPRVVPQHFFLGIETGGRVEGEAAGQPVTLRPGGVLWIQPGVPHNLHLHGQNAFTRFARVFIGNDKTNPRLPAYLSVSDRPALLALFTQLMPRLAVRQPIEPLRQRAVVAAMLANFFGGDTHGSLGIGLKPSQRRAAVAFIHDRIADRFSIDDLAAYVGLNPAYFTQQFKKNFGMPPQRYVTTERVRVAASMLSEGNMNVTAVAEAMGYESVYFFSRQFKSVMGAGPRRWRQRREGRQAKPPATVQ